jgi:hypothetical protein
MCNKKQSSWGAYHSETVKAVQNSGVPHKLCAQMSAAPNEIPAGLGFAESVDLFSGSGCLWR